MSRYVIDTENDNLLDLVTTNWITGGINIDTKEMFTSVCGDVKWIETLDQADLIVGHNLIGYDLPVLYKLYNWRPNKKTKLHDTMLMSQAQDYRRFESGRHRLEDWGDFFNFPKIDFTDFSKYSQEMHDYWIRDVQLTLRVYEYLRKEMNQMVARKACFRQSIVNEHEVAKYCSQAQEIGWRFDKEAAIALLGKMEEEMTKTEAILNPMLRTRIIPTDGLDTNGWAKFKEPTWIKNGNYNSHTARYLGCLPEEGRLDSPPCQGPFTRVEEFVPTISNMEDVKAWLYSIGWEPDDWNIKRVLNEDTGRWENIRTSPKLSEVSLLALGEPGRLLNDYTTTKSRHGILSGWIEGLDDKGRLHGSCFTIATPTGRARHSVLVNVPGADNPWGREIRSLFIADPGYRIVGADSSGNQFRALCHYLKNDEYTNLVLTGDVHSKNAEILTAILREENVYKADQSVARKTAKPFIYAYLFGAGGEKLSLIVLGKRDKKIGNKLKDGFGKRVPGLSDLVEKIDKIYSATKKTGWPYIYGADGRKVYCDSIHKALNYLLQSFEAISCKAAVAYQMQKLDEEGIPWIPLVWYHDENEFEVPEEFAERAREIAIEGYREAGKVFGMMILDGAGKIGNSWYDVH